MKHFTQLSIYLAAALFITIHHSFASTESTEIKIFSTQSYKEIINNNKKDQMIMVFWSIECIPCLKDMRTIANLSKQERKNFVFIATDGHELKNKIRELLNEMRLATENNWVFNSNQIDEIINTVDSSWYGETPRSYMIDNKRNIRRLEN